MRQFHEPVHGPFRPQGTGSGHSESPRRPAATTDQAVRGRIRTVFPDRARLCAWTGSPASAAVQRAFRQVAGDGLPVHVAGAGAGGHRPVYGHRRGRLSRLRPLFLQAGCRADGRAESGRFRFTAAKGTDLFPVYRLHRHDRRNGRDPRSVGVYAEQETGLRQRSPGDRSFAG